MEGIPAKDSLLKRFCIEGMQVLHRRNTMEGIPAKTVVDFLRTNIFCRYGVPKAVISDQGSHFCNRSVASVFKHFGVCHRVSTAYHPQTNGQAEVSNREIKSILEKMVKPSRKDWPIRLEEARLTTC